MADTALATNGTHELSTVRHQTLQAHAAMLRQEIMRRAGITFNGERDLYESLGYKRDLRFEDYVARYARGGLAARIIDAFPAATWRLPPTVREVGKSDETVKSPFEQAWEALATRLNLWQTFARVDRLASLGHYAVLVVNLRGQTDWATPATPVRSAATGDTSAVVSLHAYCEAHAAIKTLVDDETTPLFGQPEAYMIDFSRRSADKASTQRVLLPTLSGKYGNQVEVHASRVLHIAEDGLEDNIIGTPRLRAVWNYLDDLDKEAGSVAEMAWTDALRRLVLTIDADAVMTEEAEAKLSDASDELANKRRSVLRGQGLSVTQLQGALPDASNNIETRLELIAGTVRIPKRMLVGSERGELASSQDENNWATTIMERQNGYGARVVRMFIDMCIRLGVLVAPKQGYALDWPNLLAETEKDKAETAKLWSEVFKNYAGATGSPQDILPLEIFLEDIVGWSKEQVTRIMELLRGAAMQDQGGHGDTGGMANAA